MGDLVAALAGGTEARHDSIISSTIEGTMDQKSAMCGGQFLGARMSLTDMHISILKLNDRLHNPIMVDLLLDEARALAHNLYAWHDGLPQELQYSNQAPMHMFELQ
jgi:hypothetical protein